MLDVGAGTGFMALTALREHAERATATDTSPRSLRFVRFNGMLNGREERLAVHEGSLFEPVGDERFDLVVCNPPYVVSPENAFVFRDGGEGICRELVEAAPRHLEEGGIFICLVSWTHAKDADWQGPVREWTADSGCDVLAFGLASSDPLTYAAGWGRAPGRDLVVTAPRLARGWPGSWTRASSGWAGAPCCCASAARAARTGSWRDGRRRDQRPGGPQIRRLVAAQDLLAAARARSRRRPARPAARAAGRPSHRAGGRFVPDGSEVESLTLRFTSGLGTRIALDVPTAQALGALDGIRPARVVLHGSRATAWAPRIRRRSPAAAVAGFRRLLELGLLELAGRS